MQETRRALDSAREQAHALAEFRRAELMRALPELEERSLVLGTGERVVAHRFDSADRDGLIKAASALIARPGTVALLAAGNADGPGDIAVLARAEDVGRDMGRFMREALAPLGGRGGGRPGFAQGGAPVAIPIAELAGRLNGGEGA